ncbi:MAG: hypothetical protein JNK02_06920 [Planctomycetes bacterium]|nr:hypothetical protein [Planctomycetota bacterium]
MTPIPERSPTQRQDIAAIAEALALDIDGPPLVQWRDLNLHKEGHRNNHGPPRMVDDEFEAKWDAFVELMLGLIERFRSRFTATLERVAEIMRNTDLAQASKLLRQVAPNSLVTHHFIFDELNDHRWLQHLRSQRFFDHPPGIDTDEDGQESFAAWPQARYLERVAAQVPDDAHTVLRAVPDNDNPLVHRDLTLAALRLPPALAKDWAWREASWISKQPFLHWVMRDAPPRLALHLAAGGELDAAFELLHALLAPTSAPAEPPTTDPDLERLRPIPFRLDDHEYEGAIAMVLPVLVEKDPIRATTFFRDLLVEAISAGERRTPGYHTQHSHILRPAIEDHSQNSRHGHMGLLIDAVRDSTDLALHNNPSMAASIVKALENSNLVILQRSALHALRASLPSNRAIASARLLDRRLFQALECHHEYWLLAQAAFPAMQPGEQAMFLDLIERGLEFPAPPSEMSPEQQAAETAKHAQMNELWRLRCLSMLRDALPVVQRQRLTDLEETFGRVDHPEFRSWHETYWGRPGSPHAAEELARLTTDQLVELLRSWKPSGELLSASRGGLREQVAALIQQNPSHGIVRDTRLRQLGPTYVRGVLEGLARARAAGAALPVPDVLDLCHWVACQAPGAIPSWDPSTETDRTWGDAHRRVLDLIDGLVSGTGPDDVEALGEQLAAILGTLAVGPVDVYEDEDVSEPRAWAGRTTGGRAVEVLIKLLITIHQRPRATASVGQASSPPRAWSVALTILEDRLRSPLARSPALHASVGQYLQTLLALDTEWVRVRLEDLFPTAPEDEPLWRAAWEGFVLFNSAHHVSFAVIRAQYERAVRSLSHETARGRNDWDPDRHLAEHLMALQRWGVIGLEAGGLLSELFERASPVVRGHALESEGRVRMDNGETVPVEVVGRWKQLLTWRLEAARVGPKSDHQVEWRRAGWWFSDDALGVEWLLSFLGSLLATVKVVEPEHVVLKFLERAVRVRAAEAVACLGTIVDRKPDAVGYYAWRTSAEAILRAALDRGDTAARAAATGLVNRLVSRGHLHFRALLDGPGPTAE